MLFQGAESSHLDLYFEKFMMELTSLDSKGDALNYVITFLQKT